MSSGVRPLVEADLDDWIRIRRASFGTPRDPDDPDARRIMTSRLAVSRGIERDGRLAACCTWYPYPAWIGGVRVGTAALAAVVSAPASRRRGHVRELILDGLREQREAGVGWALEHPFDPRFYARMGFRTLPAGVLLDMPIERLPGDARDVAFGPTEPTDPALRDVRRAFAASHGFALDRDDPPADGDELPQRWRRLFDPPEDAATPATAYRSDDGYAIVATEGFGTSGTLHVVDAAWTGAKGRREVLAMLTAWRGQAARVRVDLPITDRVALREAQSHTRPRPVLQGRIVDLSSALGPLRSPFERELDLHVIDETCPWNDGRWRIATGPDGTRTSPSPASPATTVTAEGLVALLAGVPPAALRSAGDAEGDLASLHDLARLSADHPTFLGTADHF